MSNEEKWFHKLPTLEPHQFTTDYYVNPDNDGCRCFAGWLYTTLTGKPSQIKVQPHQYRCEDELAAAVVEATIELYPHVASPFERDVPRSLPYVNDDVLENNEQRAAVWNRARQILIERNQ